MSNRKRKTHSESITNCGDAAEATRGKARPHSQSQLGMTLSGSDTKNAHRTGVVVCRCAFTLSNGQTVRPLCPFMPWVCEGYPKRAH
jgi:hypothetical protein